MTRPISEIDEMDTLTETEFSKILKEFKNQHGNLQNFGVDETDEVDKIFEYQLLNMDFNQGETELNKQIKEELGIISDEILKIVEEVIDESFPI